MGRAARRKRAPGQSLAEFALVIPAFLLILFGVLEFGFLLFSRMTLANATREGARAAVTQVDNPQSIPAFVQSGMQANATGLVWGDVSITTTCVAEAGHPACDFVAGGDADPQPGDSISVTATYVYHSFFARFLAPSIQFSSHVVMAIE